jgi:hypothetical protein
MHREVPMLAQGLLVGWVGLFVVALLVGVTLLVRRERSARPVPDFQQQFNRDRLEPIPAEVRALMWRAAWYSDFPQELLAACQAECAAGFAGAIQRVRR